MNVFKCVLQLVLGHTDREAHGPLHLLLEHDRPITEDDIKDFGHMSVSVLSTRPMACMVAHGTEFLLNNLDPK